MCSLFSHRLGGRGSLPHETPFPPKPTLPGLLELPFHASLVGAHEHQGEGPGCVHSIELPTPTPPHQACLSFPDTCIGQQGKGRGTRS